MFGPPSLEASWTDGENTLYYTIANSSFYALSDSDGLDVNDFTGYGATISAFGDVNLTITDTFVHTTGVAKLAFYAADGADIIVQDSEFLVEGGTLYDGYANTAAQSAMVAPPWVLGISGNARGTNLLGANSTSTFVDSDFTTYSWGVLSVDAGSNGVIDVLNCSLTQTSDSGYGIYGIGDSVETFYGCTFDVGTYAAIITGGTITFTASEDYQQLTTMNNLGDTTADVISGELGSVTTVESQFGVMNHGNADITLEKGTVFNTANAAFLCKSGNVSITVDDSVINTEDGVILQVMDNDDYQVGVMEGAALSPTFNTALYEDEGFYTEAGVTSTGSTVEAAFTNIDLVGDMYNASGWSSVGGMGGPNSAQALDITLGSGATLEGVISASTYMHVQMEYNYTTEQYDYVLDADGNYIQDTEITIDEYYELGHVVNKVAYNGYNTTAVTLTDDALWTVTDTCYLSSLSVGEYATITAEDDYAVLLLVDGVVTELTAGSTYEGEIVLVIAPEGLVNSYWNSYDAYVNSNGHAKSFSVISAKVDAFLAAYEY